jgi:phage repressor protein C with HTH and peptisase S24 domain
MATVEDTRHQNLLALIAEHGTTAKLARKTGKSEAQLGQLANRHLHSKTGKPRNIGSEVARDIEAALNLPQGWMDQPHDAESHVREPTATFEVTPIFAWQHADELPPGDFVFIPRLAVRVAAGHGVEQLAIEFEKSLPQAYRAEWIRKRRLRPNRLAVIYAKGDSMETRIHDGDTLLIDTSETTIVDGGVYALWYDGGERVKRLFRRPGGGLIIHSDNAARYPALSLTADECATLRVIGRVVDVSGGGGL